MSGIAEAQRVGGVSGREFLFKILVIGDYGVGEFSIVSQGVMGRKRCENSLHTPATNEDILCFSYTYLLCFFFYVCRGK